MPKRALLFTRQLALTSCRSVLPRIMSRHLRMFFLIAMWRAKEEGSRMVMARPYGLFKPTIAASLCITDNTRRKR